MRMTMGILAASGAGAVSGAGIITVGFQSPWYGYISGNMGQVTHPSIISRIIWQSSSVIFGITTTTNVGSMAIAGTTIDFSTFTYNNGLYQSSFGIPVASVPLTVGATVPYQLIGVPGA